MTPLGLLLVGLGVILLWAAVVDQSPIDLVSGIYDQGG